MKTYNIPNSEGIKTVRTSLDNFPGETIASKVIATFLSLILTLSNFVFNCKNCIQIKDYAMGTIFAPSYANILTDHFERKYTTPFLQNSFINIFKVHRQYILYMDRKLRTTYSEFRRIK